MCSATRVSGSIGVVERPEQKHLDSILTRMDEQWSVVKDPQHAKGILQMFRHCHTVGRNMPKRMMVRFALAKDAEAGKLWVLPDARGVFQGEVCTLQAATRPLPKLQTGSPRLSSMGIYNYLTEWNA